MASTLSGDSAVLISGPDGEHLRVATAFGTSMLPFIKPGTDLCLESVKADAIRLGDVITFYFRPGVLVTHRVIKVICQKGQRLFLTKGDNRLNCDPVVSVPQITGRVLLVGRINIRSFAWLFFGRILAGISYIQFALYYRLAGSGLNKLRHRLEKKGRCPKIRLSDWFAAVTYPFNWLTRLLHALKKNKTG